MSSRVNGVPDLGHHRLHVLSRVCEVRSRNRLDISPGPAMGPRAVLLYWFTWNLGDSLLQYVLSNLVNR